MSIAATTVRDPQNPYSPTKANDPGTDLVEIVMQYYRGHRGQFTSTEATNIATQITNILNGTTKV